MSLWLGVDPRSDHPIQLDISPYAYSWNNPINLNDPDGMCPWCGGAIIGMALDVGFQLAVIALDDNKTLNDFSVTSVLISGVAGATGVGITQKIHKMSNLNKISKGTTTALSMTVDGTISAGSQYAKTGEVDMKAVAVDVFAGQAVGNILGDAAKAKASSSSKGQTYQSAVNTQKNVARGKSRQQGVKKSDANIPAAENMLESFIAGKSAGAAVSGSNVASSTVNLLLPFIPETNNQNNSNSQTKSTTTSGGPPVFIPPADIQGN